MRCHPETHHFWMGSCNIFLSLISVGSDRVLPSCPSGQQWTLWCHFPLSCRGLWFLIRTVRTCPINDTRWVGTQYWLLYKKFNTHWLCSYATAQHKHKSKHACMCVFMADLTHGTLSGRLCFNQKRDGLILSSIHSSESITAPTQVKRLHIILAAGVIPVFIRTDRLKRSRRWGRASNGLQTILPPVQVSYETDSFPSIYHRKLMP